LRKEKLSRNTLCEDKRELIAEMAGFQNVQTDDITELNDKLFRNWLKKRLYIRMTGYLVELKSGFEIEMNL